ncbi:MAG: hypothetical protein BWX52_01970 [Bacteroidetes bacterium ADurb.Bin013]|nr:MAG: hypothetical protein BWX52_01970 [Bacteroidetes bacterium ADurb.Bin013]
MIISVNSDVSAMHLCKGAGGSGAISTVGDSFAPGTWSDWFLRTYFLRMVLLI